MSSLRRPSLTESALPAARSPPHPTPCPSPRSYNLQQLNHFKRTAEGKRDDEHVEKHYWTYFLLDFLALTGTCARNQRMHFNEP